MIEDPIVEEIRQHRKTHAAEYGNDLRLIVQSLRKRERESDRPLLNPGPKKQLSPTDIQGGGDSPKHSKCVPFVICVFKFTYHRC